ncbi:MAG TPA: hypothetical protein PLM16_02585, partial [Candidatus Woesebacteria bacterium]|nr:hypothetical protein [Candidatus Woesebacteria bacterium]
MNTPNSAVSPIKTTTSSTITYADFAKLDLRVGLVKEASLPDWSEKLIELKVDFGEELGERKILAGLRKWYSSLADSDPSKRHKHYQYVDKRGIYFASDLRKPQPTSRS